MISMECELKSLKCCTCVYHKVDGNFIHFPEIEIYIKSLIIDVLHKPMTYLYDLIEGYLKDNTNPDPIFVEFLISPFVIDDYSRKQFVRKLWKVLLRQKNLWTSALGGQFCFIHGPI